MTFRFLKQLSLATSVGLGSLLASLPVSAQEPQALGELALINLHLEPYFQFTEPKQGGFELGQSFVRFQWRRDELLSGVVALGNSTLIGVPNRYAIETQANELAVVEAYAQASGNYGRLRAGLVPIPFGGEGGDTEARRHLPRSLLFQNRWVNIRDYGLSYHISHEGFFTDWAVHNGEGGSDLDNEGWFTARWGWSGWNFLRLGLSGTTGRTTPDSTSFSGTDPRTLETGMDVSLPARIRMATAFLDWQTYPLTLSLETTMGDTHQGNTEIKMKAMRADVEYELTSNFGLLLRYDSLDPRDDQRGDLVTEGTLGFAWRSRYSTSVFYVLGTKTVQEDVNPDSHRMLLIWRMTPIATGFRSLL